MMIIILVMEMERTSQKDSKNKHPVITEVDYINQKFTKCWYEDKEKHMPSSN